MKILGMKYLGHDSVICYIDTKKEEIFAMSLERYTRNKHDAFVVDELIDEYNIEYDVVAQTMEVGSHIVHDIRVNDKAVKCARKSICSKELFFVKILYYQLSFYISTCF